MQAIRAIVHIIRGRTFSVVQVRSVNIPRIIHSESLKNIATLGLKVPLEMSRTCQNHTSDCCLAYVTLAIGAGAAIALHNPSAFRAILGRGSNSSDVAMAFLHD